MKIYVVATLLFVSVGVAYGGAEEIDASHQAELMIRNLPEFLALERKYAKNPQDIDVDSWGLVAGGYGSEKIFGGDSHAEYYHVDVYLMVHDPTGDDGHGWPWGQFAIDKMTGAIFLRVINESCTALVWVPLADGRRRKWLAVSNQLPDPTSPSVTPPAGAGAAPSVAAAH